MNGTWENSDWSTSQSEGGLTTPKAWVENTAAVFAVNSGSSTPAFTVTMNSTHTVAGFFDGPLNPDPCTVTVNGSGTIVLPASTQQGFEITSDSGDPGSLTIAVPIIGSAQVVPEGSGSLYLNAANTYSGGTQLGFPPSTAFTGSIYFNNNSSFGTGTISMSTGTGGSLIAEGSGAYALANAFSLSNLTLNIAGTPAGVTFSGPWDMGNIGSSTLNLAGAANDIVTISGAMSDLEGLVESGTGFLVLSGNNNTYGSSGSTQVSGGELVLANTSGSATGVSTIVVGSGGALTGNGAATGTVNNSGIVSATNMAGGTATLTTGGQTWAASTAYQWAMNNATGAAGAASGWDELVINGGLTNNASTSYPLVIDIISLTSANLQGALGTFVNTQDYSWLVIHSTNPPTPMVGFSTSTVSLNSSSFANAVGAGVFSVSTNNTSSGGDLFVNFVHTPVLVLSNVTTNAGSNAVFFASNSVPNSTAATAAYSWKSNNVVLSDGGRISGSATPFLTIANAQTSDDATYSVTASNPAGTDVVAAVLTVTAAATSVTWATPFPITYGTALDSNELDAVANIPGNFVYSPPAGTVLNSGTYTLSTVFTPSNNSYASATNMVSLVVSLEPLTVTAANAYRPQGTANPAFTGTITGVTNGDSISATYSSSATTGSPVGTYAIMPALNPNNSLTNYSVTLVNGTLDVGSIITWIPDPLTYGTPLGSSQLDATAEVAGSFVYVPASGAALNAGTNMLSTTFTPTDTTDYNTTNTNVSLVVSPAPLTVTASNVTRQAGTPNPVFTGSIIGLENGDNITATFSSSANSASSAGTYSIVPALVDPNNRLTNYSTNLVDGILTVTAPPPPITASTPNIIPLPVTLSNLPGIFTLCPPQPGTPAPAHALMKIVVDGASQQTGQYLAAALFKSTGYQFQVSTNTSTNAVKQAILITTSNAISTLGTEGYELTLAPDSVVIRAPAQGGTFYGVQSLLQLLPPQIYSPYMVTNVAWIAPCVYIQDYPQFSWRGVMLDVARHFFNKQEVKQVLDGMAMHKLNTFHWHLSDDQGWRLQITNYPALTTNSAWRSGIDFNLARRATTATNAAGLYGGYYTQADAREVVAYAAERHITVVPELEMPCHSTASLASFPQFGCGNSSNSYNPDEISICGSCYDVDLWSLGTPGTMAFLEEILSETMAIFPGKFIHCGGDEVVQSGDTQWLSYNADVTNYEAIYGSAPSGDNSIRAYQRWFSTNLATFIQSKGHMMMAWSDFEADGVVPNAGDMDYTGTSGATAASNGVPVVMAPSGSCYINYVEGSSSSLKYEPPFFVGGAPSYLTVNSVYSFSPIPSALSSAYTNEILGAECPLWGEYVPSFENVMFKMFPRASAMAEVTWTPSALHNYASFTNRLVVQKQRFTQMGLNYDHEIIPTIGTWGPTVSASATTTYYDITPNVTAAGEVDVNFYYTGGGDALAITSVALLVNNVQVDIDAHSGLAEPSADYDTPPYAPLFTLYVLHLPELVPGATYTIQAVYQSSGGTTTSGTIYLPNWD